MSELLSCEPQQHMLHETLADKLLRGEEQPHDFLSKLMEVDQATMTHHDAIRNFQLLSDPKIIAFFETKASPQDNLSLRKDRAFFAWHQAQFSLFTSSDSAHGEANVALAVELGSDVISWLKTHSDDSRLDTVQRLGYLKSIMTYQPFLDYMKASLLYLQNKPDEMQDLVIQMYRHEQNATDEQSNAQNIVILVNMLQGLRKRREPKYVEDYHL